MRPASATATCTCSRRGFNHPLPVLLGHEGAGVVEAVGEGVETVDVGERVVLGWRAPCGACLWCERGDEHLCRTPATAGPRMRVRGDGDLSRAFGLGTFADRIVAHERTAISVGDLPPEQACLLGCAVATGVCSALRTAGVWPGARVGVIGCGAVGLCAIQGARIAGAAEVHALDLDERKLEAARRFGATHTGEAKRLDFVFDVVGPPGDRGAGRSRCSGTRARSSTSACRTPTRASSSRSSRSSTGAYRFLVSHGGDHVPARDFPRSWSTRARVGSTSPEW